MIRLIIDPWGTPALGINRVIFLESIASGPTMGALSQVFSKNKYLSAIGVNSKIGDECFLGSGSTIGENVNLASGTMLCENSYANKSSNTTNCVLLGNPARPICRS